MVGSISRAWLPVTVNRALRHAPKRPFISPTCRFLPQENRQVGETARTTTDTHGRTRTTTTDPRRHPEGPSGAEGPPIGCPLHCRIAQPQGPAASGAKPRRRPPGGPSTSCQDDGKGTATGAAPHRLAPASPCRGGLPEQPRQHGAQHRGPDPVAVFIQVQLVGAEEVVARLGVVGHQVAGHIDVP